MLYCFQCKKVTKTAKPILCVPLFVLDTFHSVVFIEDESYENMCLKNEI